MNTPFFRIIDLETGEEADPQKIVIADEPWVNGLLYCDIDGWVIDEFGGLGLTDDCGNVRWAPLGRFRIEFLVELETVH